jgi:PAS domain S-box-containing protein
MANARILVVEDDAIVAAHLERVLGQIGYAVAGLVATGEEAVEQAGASRPDVVLMDIRLRSEMTGIEAAQQIHSQLDLPVVYLTAYADEPLLQQAQVTEPYGYLAKPVRDKELHATLEMALYKHRTDRRIHHLNQVLRAIRDVNQLITRERDPQRLLDAACQILVRTRGYLLVWIGQAGPDYRVIPAARSGQGADYLDEVTITWDETALRTRQPEVCEDIATDPRFAIWKEAALGRGYASSAAVPMLHTDRLFGVLCVYADQPHAFDQEELDLLREVAGDLAFALRSIEDEAERRRAEEALRENEAKYRTLVEQIPASVYIAALDETSGTLYQSPQIEQIVGFTADEWVADPELWANRLHPDDRGRVLAEVAHSHASSEPFRSEYRLRVRDGRVVWVRDEAVIVRDETGRPLFLQGILYDITERKQAEDAMQQQFLRISLLNQITRAIAEHQDLSSIFHVVLQHLEDHLPMDFGGVFLYGPDTDMLTVAARGLKSQPLAAELGLPEGTSVAVDQVWMRSCLEGQTTYVPDTAQIDAPVTQKLAQLGIRTTMAMPLAAGNTVFGLLIAARREMDGFTGAEREFLQVLCEHVALAAHQAQLHQDLQRTYDHLRQTQQALLHQEQLRALGTMASGITHDINNALSPVTGYAEMLLDSEPNLSERTRRYLELIHRAGKDIGHTVSRLREFYRPRDEGQPLRPVNLCQLVKQAVELTQPRWKDTSQQQGFVVEVQTDLPEVPPNVWGEESEIREALTNLIFNAVDAMPEGGTITIRIIADCGLRIAESGTPSEIRNPKSEIRNVVVEVADTGLGMDEETRQHCLDPFYTTKGQRGSGLGLAMVFGIMQRHDGDVEIESEPGQGTTVRLIFPLRPLQEVSVSAAPPTTVPVRPLRILCVDDEPVLLELLKEMLEKEGHTVEAAGGGQAGLEIFHTAQEGGEAFDVVITDLGMPYVDGQEVARTVKQGSPETPVIMLTGWKGLLRETGEIPTPVDLLLGKPPKLQELRQALWQVTEGQ